MNMKDYEELSRARREANDNRDIVAFRCTGALKALVELVDMATDLESAKAFAANAKKYLDEYDKANLALECAVRDLNECFNTEAMCASIKED